MQIGGQEFVFRSDGSSVSIANTPFYAGIFVTNAIYGSGALGANSTGDAAFGIDPSIEKTQVERLHRNLEDEKRILNDERAKRLTDLLEGKEVLADLHDEKTNKKLFAKGAILDRESIEKTRSRG